MIIIAEKFVRQLLYTTSNCWRKDPAWVQFVHFVHVSYTRVKLFLQHDVFSALTWVCVDYIQEAILWRWADLASGTYCCIDNINFNTLRDGKSKPVNEFIDVVACCMFAWHVHARLCTPFTICTQSEHASIVFGSQDLSAALIHMQWLVSCYVVLNLYTLVCSDTLVT